MSPDEQTVYKSMVHNLSFMKRQQLVLALLRQKIRRLLLCPSSLAGEGGLNVQQIRLGEGF